MNIIYYKHSIFAIWQMLQMTYNNFMPPIIRNKQKIKTKMETKIIMVYWSIQSSDAF